MKRLLILVLFYSAAVQADPFNIYLPSSFHFTPGTIERLDFSYTLGVIDAANNFQLQIAPVSGDDVYIKESDDYGFAYGISMGLGHGLEAGLFLDAGGQYFSVKYDLNDKADVSLHSLVLASVRSNNYGHSGVKLEEADDCGFLNLLCIFNTGTVWHDTYEYDYEAVVSGLTLAYLYGYQYSDLLMLYSGVYYAAYDIDFSLTDNTGGGSNQSGHVNADLAAITLGARWNLAKLNHSADNKYVLLNYTLFKGSLSHDGEQEPVLKLLFVMEF